MSTSIGLLTSFVAVVALLVQRLVNLLGFMSNQYAITRETTEFLGPLRCQACVFRNSKCFVNRESRSCFHCSSDSACLFTRTIERTNTKTSFSWEELLGKNASQKFSQDNQDAPQLDRTIFSNEETFTPLQCFESRDESYDIEFSERDYDPYLMGSPSESSSTANWMPQTATSRRRYGSPSTCDASRHDAPRSIYAGVAGHTSEFPIVESVHEQTHPSRNTSMPNRSSSSIGDSMANLDPRMTSPKSSTARALPSKGAQSRVTGEIPETTSHDFVYETFNSASRSMESRRGRRRGKLSESSASSANRLRSIGACWRCKLQKNQASPITIGIHKVYLQLSV